MGNGSLGKRKNPNQELGLAVCPLDTTNYGVVPGNFCTYPFVYLQVLSDRITLMMDRL